MGMLLTVLLCIAVFVVFIVAVLVVSPFQVVASGGYREYAFSGGALFSFIHPKVVMITVDVAKRSFDLKLFGYSFAKKKKTPEPEDVTAVHEDHGTTEASGKEGETGTRRRKDAEKDKREEAEVTEDAGTLRTGEEAEQQGSEDDERRVEAVTDGPGTDDEGGKPEVQKDVYLLNEQENIDHTELETKVITISAGGEQVQPIVQKPQQSQSQEHRAEQPQQEKPEPATGDANAVKDTSTATDKKGGDAAYADEKVAHKTLKKDNWFKRLERNRYWFFIRNSRWRNKIIRWIFRFLKSLLHILKFDRFQLKIRAGVMNPSMVGVINGWYQSLFYGLPMKKPYMVRFEPVFMKSHFEGTISLRVGTSVVRLLMPLLIALATLPWFHTLWLVWKVYRRERTCKRLAAGK